MQGQQHGGISRRRMYWDQARQVSPAAQDSELATQRNPQAKTGLRGESGTGNAEALVEFVVEEPATGLVGLEPFAVNDHLGDGALAYVADNFVGGGGIEIHIDFRIRNAVSFEKLLGGTAIASPCRRVNLHFHDRDFTVFRIRLHVPHLTPFALRSRNHDCR